MPETGQSQEGLFASLRRVLSTALALLQTRVALFSVELQEEKSRLSKLVLLICGIVVTGFLAFIMGSLTLVCAFWDQRLAVLAGLTIFYGGAALGLGLGLRASLRSPHLPFSATLEELKKDRACLERKN